MRAEVAACLLSALCVGTWLWAAPSMASPAQRSPELVVVANPQAQQSQLDGARLRAIFTGRVVLWPNGKAVVPINWAPGSEGRVDFDIAVLGLTPERVAKLWMDELVRGGARAPRSFADPSLVGRVVARLPGSIGYVLGAQVPDGVTRVARIAGLSVLPP